jgi:hypothetical protein
MLAKLHRNSNDLLERSISLTSLVLRHCFQIFFGLQDEKKAEAAQVAAVEICLKEMHRRQRLGLPVGRLIPLLGGISSSKLSQRRRDFSEIQPCLAV